MPQPGEQDHHNEGSQWHNYRNQNVLQRQQLHRIGRLLEKKSDRCTMSTQTHLIPPFSSYDAFNGTEVNKKLRQIAGYESGKELLDQKIRKDISEETRSIRELIVVAPR